MGRRAGGRAPWCVLVRRLKRLIYYSKLLFGCTGAAELVKIVFDSTDPPMIAVAEDGLSYIVNTLFRHGSPCRHHMLRLKVSFDPQQMGCREIWGILQWSESEPPTRTSKPCLAVHNYNNEHSSNNK